MVYLDSVVTKNYGLIVLKYINFVFLNIFVKSALKINECLKTLTSNEFTKFIYFKVIAPQIIYTVFMGCELKPFYMTYIKIIIVIIIK